jgi:hypothetical protein
MDSGDFMSKKFLIFLVSVLVVSTTRAQFVEEVGTLESLYESRARAVLNSFLRPHEYTIVISADIDRDQKKLDEYREKMELQYIPGLPIPADPTMTPATNDLHSMKTKVAVNLILTAEVSPEKEALLKSILMSKLHLDETTGDSITISRAKLPDPNSSQKEPRILPDFTWKTWALIFLLSLMTLAGIVFWVSKRKNEAEEKKLANPQPHSHPSIWPFGDKESGPDSEADLGKKSSSVTESDVQDAKDQLLFIVTQYPQISSNTITDLLEHGEDTTVIRVFEYFSWDLSRKLFPAISPRVWGRLGAKVRDRNEQPSLEEYLQSIQYIYKAVLSRFLESGADKDENNPFSFLFRLTPSERSQVLAGEPAMTFAMISLYSQGDDLGLLMSSASSALQNQIPVEISRLESLPESSLTALANRLKDRMLAIKAAPAVLADGPALASRVLRSYTPEREAEVYQKMKTEDPAGAEKIRRTLVMFEDLSIYPSEIVSTVLSVMDLDQVVVALFGLGSGSRDVLLSWIPPKRAKMIERDLERPGLNPLQSETYSARRVICQKVEEAIKFRNQTVEMVWAQIDAKNSIGHLKSAS